MELLQLMYFVELAEHEHLTKVANKMFVSPPAISNSISRLEKELGVQLFFREGRNIRLNPYGEVFLRHAKNCLREIDDGIKELNDMNSSLLSKKSLIVATSTPYIWNRQVYNFSLNHPEIELKMLSHEALNGNRLAPNVELLIASPQSFSDDKWSSKLLFIDRLAVAVPPQSHLYLKDTCTLDDLKDEWLIDLSETAFKEYVRALCEKHGFIPKSRISCDYTLRPRISLNEGIPFISLFNCEHVDLYQGLKFIPITDDDAIREQAIFWRKDRYISVAAQHFISYLSDFYIDYQPC